MAIRSESGAYQEIAEHVFAVPPSWQKKSTVARKKAKSKRFSFGGISSLTLIVCVSLVLAKVF